MTVLLNIAQLNALKAAVDDLLGYLGDNSCCDPDCCGGPFYERDDALIGAKVLALFGLRYEPAEGDPSL